MTDIRLAWDNDAFAGDALVDAFDLAADDTLATAVLISLFTDRRVSREELPDGETSQRGWWGDSLTEDDRIGSRLWLLGRGKQTVEVQARAEDYCREALAWLVEDAVVERVEVAASWTRRGWLDVTVSVTLPDGAAADYQFEDVLRAA